MKSGRSSLYVYLSLLLAGICMLGVAEYSAAQEGVPGIILCFIPSGALIGLGIRLWYSAKTRKHHQLELAEIETSHQQALDTLTAAKIGELEELQVKSWLKVLMKPYWRAKVPEVEVETKFVFPLLRYLGYKESNMAMRVPVPMQEGSSKTMREADWVVWDENGNALVVVEVKAPNVSLSETVAKQARSYAFRLGAPAYITTNGKEIEVFHRGIIKDICVLSCATSQLSEKWGAIQSLAGKSNVIALRHQFTDEE
jgi:hypothetical protein